VKIIPPTKVNATVPSDLNGLYDSYRQHWTPYYTGSVVQYAESNLSLHPPRFVVTGPVDLHRNKYLIAPLLALTDSETRQVNVAASVQCFGKGTEVLMYDYSIKNIEDIIIGDIVMGDDWTPRTVTDSHVGSEELYRISSPINSMKPYVVSKRHIMCFKKLTCKTNTYSKVEIPLNEYLTNPNRTKSNIYFGYTAGIKAGGSKSALPLDPYMLGIWLGDGCSHKPSITNMEPELIDYMTEYAQLNKIRLGVFRKTNPPNLAALYRFRGHPKMPNYFTLALRELNLINNKHIPIQYFKASLDVRRRLLAGIIDTDGYKSPQKHARNTCEIAQTNDIMSRDIVLLARTLGYDVHVTKKRVTCQNGFVGFTNRISLYGDLSTIPTKVRRKQYDSNTLRRIPNKYSIEITPLGVGNYYGIVVDGNSKFLLSDTSVVHNTGKSLMSSLWATYLAEHGNGTMLRVYQTGKMAERASITEFLAILESNKILAKILPNGEHKKRVTVLDYLFPALNIHYCSPTENNLQSLTVNYLHCDECYLYPNGFIAEAKARTDACAFSRKILLTSIPGTDTDEWYQEYDRGDQYSWSWHCPHCQTLQEWEWFVRPEVGTPYGIIYDDNNVTRPEGKWNFTEVKKTIRLVCKDCGKPIPIVRENEGKIENDTTVLRQLNDNGEYLLTNNKNNPTIKSFRWPAFASIDTPIPELVVDYLQRKDLMRDTGVNTLIKDFHQKKLAKFWVENLRVESKDLILAEYDPNQLTEGLNIMTIDCQNNFLEFYWLILNWSKEGNARVKAYGRCPDWTSLRQTQLDHKIPDQRVLIDSGYTATEVYKKCVEYSHPFWVGGKQLTLTWIALKGDYAKDFIHAGNVRKLYSPVGYGDPMSGQSTLPGRKNLAVKCPLYRWSSYSIQELFVAMRDGQGRKLEVAPSLMSDELTKHFNSHYQTFEVDKKTQKPVKMFKCRSGVPDHYLDAACMNIVGAMLAGYFKC
jgi:hypothetical protein